MDAVKKELLMDAFADDYMTPEAIELVARARALAPKLAERARAMESTRPRVWCGEWTKATSWSPDNPLSNCTPRTQHGWNSPANGPNAPS
jgi:hypothetical protein